MIVLHCPRCDQTINVSDFLAGFTVVCKSCKSRVDVPRESQVAENGAVGKDLEPIGDQDVQASTNDDPVRVQIPAGSRFRILRLHAKGGLGLVSVAYDEELHREVALKEIQECHADDQESRARFLVEAEITGRLEHPGIVPVYALGRYADGRPFYAMRFIKGDSLKDAIDRFHKATTYGRDPGEQTLELRQLLSRFSAVCQAIQYAHDRGILHRDLKPSNIMLGKYGETLVVDWGSAKALGKKESASAEATLNPASGGDGSETLPGSAIGTPAYMSPEQAAGRLDQLGPASDVYSLGATLYALLTGAPPFEDPDIAAILNKVQHGDFPRPRLVNHYTDSALEAICLKAMSLKIADRYESPRALAADLERWLADKPVSAWPEPWTVKTRRWVGQHRMLMTGTAAALLVGVAGLGIISLVLGSAFEVEKKLNADLVKANDAEKKAGENAIAKETEARTQEQIAKRNEVDAKAERKKALEQTKRAEDALALSELRYYVSKITLARLDWEAHRTREAWMHLEDTPLALRGWEFHYLRGLFESSQRILRDPAGPVIDAVFSSDGRWCASPTQDDMVRLWDLQKQESFVLKGHTAAVHAVAFSSDCKRLASGSEDGTVRLWDVENAQKAAPLVLKAHTAKVNVLAFSPDGKRLASASAVGTKGGSPADKTVLVWDLDKEDDPLTLDVTSKFNRNLGLTFSPDSKRLAVADGRVWLWDLDKAPSMLKGLGFLSYVVAFSPDGKTLAIGGGVTMRLFDAEKMQLGTWTKHEAGFKPGQTILGIDAARFSPDGKRLAGGAKDRVLLWNLDKDDEPIILKGHAFAFSRDGKRLATGSTDSTVRLLDLDKGQELHLLKGHTSGVSAVAFSPDGKQLASAGDNTLRLWDTDKGQEPLVFNPFGAGALGLALSRDGKRLATGSPVAWKSGAIKRPENSVQMWDVDKGQLWDEDKGQKPLVLSGHSSSVWSVAISPDGKWLASSSDDGEILLWDPEKGPASLRKPKGKGLPLKQGQVPLVLKGHTKPVRSLAFSPDSKRLASGSSDGTVRLWNLDKGMEPLVLKGHNGWVITVAFSPDGKRLAIAAADHTARIWDLDKGQEPLVLQIPYPAPFGPEPASPGALGFTRFAGVDSASFSPDLTRLASASNKDGTIRLWDLVTGKELLVLKGQNGNKVDAVAFSRDGKRLASGFRDGTVRLWDAESGVEMLVLRHTGSACFLAFSADGARLAAGGPGGHVWVWEAPGAKIGSEPK
jgi:WD40 repeat protein/tRNA A-37 threonylcarbamoyl transferase component Bud32